MTLEVMALSQEEKQRTPAGLFRLLGRGKHVKYKVVDHVHARRAPRCGWHVPVPAGFNLSARVAATLAALAQKLQMAPHCSVFQSALMKLLDEHSDTVLPPPFWEELGAGASGKLKCAVANAVIAAQNGQSDGPCRILSSLTAGIEGKLTRASLRDGSTSWRQWVLESLAKGACQARRFCLPQEDVATLPSSTGSLSRSQLAVDASLHWEEVWQTGDEDRTQRVIGAIAKLRQKVLRNGEARVFAQSLTAEYIQKAATTFPRRTSIGPDHLEFHVIANLPILLIQPLLAVVQSMIQSLSWAPQVLHNWISLLAKKQGGHRTIAIMTTTVRLVMRLLCKPLRAWDVEYALPGDTAAAGRQALVQIAARFGANEVARALGRRTAQVLWDASAFYDTLDLERLCVDVEDFAFPGPAAVMALQAHMAPRRLRIGQAYGHNISAPGRGVLAGCSSSTSLSRLYLARPLRVAIDAGHTDDDIGVNVDDVCQSTHDVCDSKVAEAAIAKGREFAEEATAKGLTISPKSVAVASSIALARRIAAGLSRGGLSVKAQIRTEDLGNGVMPGRRTTIAFKHRLSLGLRRAGRVAVLRNAAGSAAGKLFATGVRPQQCYGHTVAGMALGQTRTLLQAARRVLGPAGMRPCPVTIVALRLGIMPVVQAQTDQIRLWMQLWQRTQLRADYTKAWGVIRDETSNLDEKAARARTSGPIGACINVLRYAGWTPTQPDGWLAPEQRMAIVAAPEPHGDADVIAAVSADLEAVAWKECAAHFMGRCLEQGKPSFAAHAVVKRRPSKLADAEKQQETPHEPGPLNLPSACMRVSALDAVVEGGSTVGERYNPAQPCLRCGHPNETVLHRVFACPANACPALRQLDGSIARTDFIGQSLLDGKHEFEECFLARGIIPASKCSLIATEVTSEEPTELGDF